MSTSNSDDPMAVCDVKVCRICLTTDDTLQEMRANKTLQEAYEAITALLMEQEDKLPPYLCDECARQLQDCTRFRTKTLRAHALLLEIIRKYDRITLESIQALKPDSLDNNPNTVDLTRTECLNTNNQYNINIECIKNENIQIDEQDEGSSDVEIVGIKRERDDDINDIPNEDNGLGVTVCISNLKEDVDGFSTEVNETNQDTHVQEPTNNIRGNTLVGEDYTSDDCPLEEVRQQAKRKAAEIEKVLKGSTNISQVINTTRKPTIEELLTKNKGSTDVISGEKDSNLQADNKDSAKTKYYCDLCTFENISKKKLIYHIKAHFGKKPYPSKKTVGKKSNQSRPGRGVQEQSFVCNVCNKSFSASSTLQRHLRKHSDVKPYPCDQCTKAFTRKYQLHTHLRTHTGEKPHLCDICNKSFNEKCNLQRHIMKHSGLKPHSCDQCGKTFISKYELQGHYRMHSGERPYPCYTCDKSFTRKYDLNRHLREHLGVKQFKCNVCDKQFIRKSTLREHLINHSGEKPYSCDHCKIAFARKTDLQRHLREHFGNKPYSCEICKKSFSRNSGLKLHLKKHSGDKPYVCDVCNKGFIQKCNLAKHVAIHFETKSFNCEVCNKKFTTKDLLKIHSKEHGKKYSCKVCRKQFTTYYYLKVHSKEHSGEK